VKPVLETIERKKEEFAALPLFVFMRDQALTAEQRLIFYPGMAHFIMSFADLNKYVLREEKDGDCYQRLVNAHTHEDDHHWVWYVEDLRALGGERMRTGNGALNFLWGDETVAGRVLSYRLAHLIASANSAQRLALIEAMEETANVFFTESSRLAARIESERGVRLKFYGQFHFDVDSNHTLHAEEGLLASVELDAETRTQTMAMVAEIFRLFSDWMDALLRIAMKELLRQNRRAVMAAHS
jgi:hypothetical protein